MDKSTGPKASSPSFGPYRRIGARRNERSREVQANNSNLTVIMGRHVPITFLYLVYIVK
jgi:hypothetical protein